MKKRIAYWTQITIAARSEAELKSVLNSVDWKIRMIVDVPTAFWRGRIRHSPILNEDEAAFLNYEGYNEKKLRRRKVL